MRTTIIATVVCTTLAAIPALVPSCGEKPAPVKPEPRPPAPIVVTPDPTPCILAPAPAPLESLRARAITAGDWVRIDQDGNEDTAIRLPDGLFVPRSRWDALVLYLFALQEVVIDAKRCHPESNAPGAVP